MKQTPIIKKRIINGKECIHITFKGNDIPYYAYGRAYIRVGDEDRKLSAKEIENIIVTKNKERLSWDGYVCEKAGLRDVAPKKLKAFTEIAGLKHTTAASTLEKLGLYINGKILNTAVILFGKKPEDFFPSASLRCAVFGTTDTAFIIDRKDYSGDLFCLIEKAEEYILEHIHIGMRVEGMYRIDVPEIDREAIREAIINAFCHRDYREYDSVNIAVFKDRVEVRNPGGLVGGLTIEQITTEMVSKRRNERIAEMFHRVHFVERWGRGISLILSKEPATSFKEVGGLFITTFKRKMYTQKEGEGETSRNVGGDVGKNVVKNVGKEQRKMIILEKIRERTPFTNKTLAEELQVSKKTIERDLIALKREGVVIFVGSKRSGYWKIVE